MHLLNNNNTMQQKPGIATVWRPSQYPNHHHCSRAKKNHARMHAPTYALGYVRSLALSKGYDICVVVVVVAVRS